MSSVNDSTSQNDTNKIREEYRKRENDLRSKHTKQLRQITDAHMKEIEQIKSSHGEQMGQYRQKMNATLTERDQQHQEAIQELRQVQQRRLENLNQATQQKIQEQRNFTQSEKKRIQEANENRFEALSENYSKNMSETNEDFFNKLKDMRVQQKEAIDGQRDQLLDKHDKEVGRMREERDLTVKEMKRNYDDYRHQAEGRMKAQDGRHSRDMKRMADSNVASVTREREARKQHERILRDGFKDNLETTKADFQKEVDRERRARERIGADFQGTVQTRIDNDIRRLQETISSLKEKSVRDQLETDRKADVRINNTIRAYQRRLDLLVDERDKMLRDFKVQNGKDIYTVQERANDQMKETARFYRQKMETENVKNRDNFLTITNDLKQRNEFTVDQADQRIATIRDDSLAKEKRLQQNYEKTLENIQDNNVKERNELRSTMLDEKEKALRVLRMKMRENDAASGRRLSSVISEFKKQIAELNDQLMRVKRQSGAREKQIVESLKKEQTAHLEAQKIQYEQRLARLRTDNDNKAQASERRHQEQMNNVLGAVRKT
ncbi:MAG: hypothetical protein H6626_03795 [Pseudobdellovibrionaceae bacterium]|nr:hypothetical protein [Bdellovibrionales bacterium]USN48221.1 MAG: hypothetical protein H6626_03795 [Pseudobdellovibrionaceae bacterium]